MFKLAFAALCGGAFLALAWRAWRLGPRAFLGALVRGLDWRLPPPKSVLKPVDQGLLILFHVGGLAYLWRLAGRSYGQALLLGAASALVLLLPQWPRAVRRRALDAAPLTALALPYLCGALAGTRLMTGGMAYLPAVVLAGAGYALLVQMQRAYGRRWPWLAPGLVALATLGWAVAEYLGARTHGVTGSDPYCYAQMAVDLARRGDVRHLFPLFNQIKSLGIPTWPVAHVGYYPPQGPAGAAATVWPAGWPALLSVGYRLLGETGLYITAPILGLLALVAVAGLAREVWKDEARPLLWLGAALAVLLLATDREQTLQLLVPMADAAALLFTLLAVWLSVRAARGNSLWLAVLAGLSLGMAYDVRHTQLFIAVPVALALWLDGGRKRVPLLCAAGLAALLAALPDLAYHRAVFGGVLRPESPELNLIGMRYWWDNARRMVGAFTTGPEFGWLWPFTLGGLVALWRRQRNLALTLVAWIVANAGTQFMYGPLRWRDLLGVLPALVVFTAYGVTAVLAGLRRWRPAPGWSAGVAALLVAVLLGLRTQPILSWPLQKVEMTFGFVTAAQRAEFTRLGSAVEPDAVLGTSLNSGPIELYTGRQTFRPGDWQPAELETFVTAMAGAGRPVYILDDGNEHGAVVARLQAEGRLTACGVFGLPLYGLASERTGMLYRVAPGSPAAP